MEACARGFQLLVPAVVLSFHDIYVLNEEIEKSALLLFCFSPAKALQFFSPAKPGALEKSLVALFFFGPALAGIYLVEPEGGVFIFFEGMASHG